MNSFLHFLLVASAACLVYSFNFEDFAVFIPLLKRTPVPTCPPNEIHQFCSGMCSDCDQRGMCLVTDCSKSGCDCMPHFVRLKPNGPCEHVSQCPIPQCGENEVFRECGPICERCSTLKCMAISCDYKCYCKNGYLRNSENVCIPAEECPKRHTCGHNEEWAESGLVNEYCLTQAGESLSEEKQNVSKCYCKKDFRRNTMGHCIGISVCPLIKCLGIEVYYNCIPQCNATCHSHADPNCKEDGNCFPGCFCPPGYAMNYFRSCIPVENCTTSSMVVKVVHQSAFGDADDTSDSDTTSGSTIDENTDTSVSTYYPDTDETSEDDQIEETSSVSEASIKESDTEPSVSPTPNPKETKGKDYSRAKASSSASSSKYTNAAASSKASSSATSSKHTNAAASSKASNQKVPEDSANE